VEIWLSKIGLTPPLFFIEVPVPSQESEQSCICVLGVSLPSQESERSCICVLGVSFMPLSMILLFDFATVQHCGISYFSFYYTENYIHCYYCVAGDYVTSFDVNGKKVLKVQPEALTMLAEQAMIDIAHLLRPGHLQVRGQSSKYDC